MGAYNLAYMFEGIVLCYECYSKLNAVDLTTKNNLSLVIIDGCDILGDRYQQPSKRIKGDKKCHKKLKKTLSLA